MTETFTDTPLPDRELDLKEIARTIMAQHNYPKEIHAYRRVTFRVEDVIAESLAIRQNFQQRDVPGPWRYIYDPLTVDHKTIMLAVIDSARIILGCHEWGCQTTADVEGLTFTDGNGKTLGTGKDLAS